MAKGEKNKRVRTPRVNITPEFIPLVPDPHKITTKQLLGIAKRDHVIFTREDRKKGLTLENVAARDLTNQRKVIFRKNTGKFYLHLCAALYGGRILRENSGLLFNGTNGWECSFKGFKPDIVIDGELKTIFGEVKATSGNMVKAKFSYKQFLGYSQALLENQGSEMFAGIFKYGSRKPEKLYVCKPKGNYTCNNRCLVESLSQMTRSLLVVPHNLLTFLLMLSHSEERDYTTSRAGNHQTYKIVLGSNLTALQNNWENPDIAINEILAKAKKRHFYLEDFTQQDFYLKDLQATQKKAPNIYCRNRKIGNIVYEKQKSMGIVGQHREPFVITEYQTPHNDDWKTHFQAEHEKFIIGLGMKRDYDQMCEWREQTQEREVIRKEPEMVIKTPDDGIPF